MSFRLCSRAPSDDQLVAVARAARDRGVATHRAAAQILAGERILDSRAICFGVPAATSSPPSRPAPGPKIDDVIGALDGLGVVLHHQHRVAHVAQVRQRFEQPLVVARMQPDGRLVQHVQHAAQLGADLRSQPDALRLAAGQRGRGAVQARDSPGPRASEIPAGGGSRPPRVRRSAPRARQAPNSLTVSSARAMGMRGELADGEALHPHRQARRAQPLALAGRAFARPTCTPSATRGSLR